MLPHFKFTNRVVYDEAELMAFASAHRREARAAIKGGLTAKNP
jgi:hypothetical protein